MAAIAAAVALFLTLLALGGFFLYNSLPGQAAAPEEDVPSAEAAEAGGVDDSVLYIEVIGEASDILVRIPGGEVLTDTTMTQGQYLSYDHAAMDVTIGSPEAVDVYVNGDRRDLSEEEPGHTFMAESGA